MAQNTNRRMTDEESKVFHRLLQTIRVKCNRNTLRTSYRDSKKRLEKVGFSIPPHMHDFQSVLGWADKAVKTPARRIKPDGFTLPRASTLLEQIEETMASQHIANVERMAVEASLLHSVSFVFTSTGDVAAGEPKAIVVARTALEATCEVDPRTFKTTFALEVVGFKKYNLYLPGKVLTLELENGEYRVKRIANGIPRRVMCTPYIWGRSLERTFGYSRVTRPLMGYIDAGVRTMLRQEVNAEFYGAPQRALLGAEREHFENSKGERIDPLEALIGGIWALPSTRDEETGDLVKPTLEQFAQATFTPHSEMLKSIALQVSSETSIPVGYLGVIHDNPTSADAIRASEADLISVVEAELPSYGAARVDVAYNVAAVLNDGWTDAMERDLRGLQSHFRDPGTSTKAEQADAGLKYVQTFPEGDPEVAMERYGLTKLEIDRNLAYMKKQRATQSTADLLLAVQPAPPAPVEGQPQLQATAQ